MLGTGFEPQAICDAMSHVTKCHKGCLQEMYTSLGEETKLLWQVDDIYMYNTQSILSHVVIDNTSSLTQLLIFAVLSMNFFLPCSCVGMLYLRASKFYNNGYFIRLILKQFKNHGEVLTSNCKK